jgi:hypothetical protein
LRQRALAWVDGQDVIACGMNNDGLEPRVLSIRDTGGQLIEITLSDRLLLGGDNPREQLRDSALLERRYAQLLRGIPVLETYPRAGAGGHGHPVISALDIDLQIQAVLGFLRRALRRIEGDDTLAARSDWERAALQARHAQERNSQRLRIIVVGGGSGSMGNAGHHLLPYLMRHVLDERGIRNYEIWGFVLGPHAFHGLTPFVQHNYRALIESLDYMARHGQRRAYAPGLVIDRQTPPYDRVFLLDDPRLPQQATRVSEAELETFFDHCALSSYLLAMRGTVWQTIASHTANDDGQEYSTLRYFNTVRASLARIDTEALHTALAARIAAGALHTLAERLHA